MIIKDWICLKMDNMWLDWARLKGAGSAPAGHGPFVFDQFSDIEWALLRKGNVYSSDYWCSDVEKE
jgi:hypothetical protein